MKRQTILALTILVTACLLAASAAKAHVRCSHWTIHSGGHTVTLECVPPGATARVQVGRRVFHRHAPGTVVRVCAVSSYEFGYRDVTVDVGPLAVGSRVAVLVDGEGGGTSC